MNSPCNIILNKSCLQLFQPYNVTCLDVTLLFQPHNVVCLHVTLLFQPHNVVCLHVTLLFQPHNIICLHVCNCFSHTMSFVSMSLCFTQCGTHASNKFKIDQENLQAFLRSDYAWYFIHEGHCICLVLETAAVISNHCRCCPVSISSRYHSTCYDLSINYMGDIFAACDLAKDRFST